MVPLALYRFLGASSLQCVSNFVLAVVAVLVRFRGASCSNLSVLYTFTDTSLKHTVATV